MNASQTVCQWWSQALAGVLAWQWKIMEAQYRIGLKVVEAAMPIPGSPGSGSDKPPGQVPQVTDKFQSLEARACEQARKGRALPSEIYEVPYRDRIDWSKFPDWARPCDPELFQECGHEG